MGKKNLHIIILSEQSVRAKSLTELIYSATGENNNVLTMRPRELRSFQDNGAKPILLVDLMGCHQPSQQIIKALKNDHKNVRIIAMHMYRSKSLITPIMSEGVDGYLYYEPSKAELAEAIKKVQNGIKFEPVYTDT